MMGSPFYYDALFDDGPGDVVFHDCMWSGICTCCIQLLHQDSFYYTNEAPDLKVDLMYQNNVTLNNHHHNHQHHHHHHPLNDNNSSSTCLARDSHLHYQSQQQHQHQQQDLKAALQQSSQHPNIRSNLSNSSDGSLTNINTSSNINDITSPKPIGRREHNDSTLDRDRRDHQNINNNINTNNSSSAINNNSSSHHHHQNNKTNSTGSRSNSSSNNTSPKPIRRREHNDSERKRRDHLRNAFNFLRDQVPRFKATNKKPPRIQILHEATLYIQRIIRESEDLERRLDEEKTEHERLQKL